MNESYETSRRQILMIKPLPSLEDVFNMITQDERQKTMKPSSKSDNVIFQAIGSHTPSTQPEIFADNSVLAAPHQQSYRPHQRPVHTYCGQLGHVIQKCFKIYGYPPGYKGPNNTHKGHQNQQSHGFSPRGQQGQHSQAPRYPGAYTQHPNANAPAYLRSNTIANVTGAPTLPLDLNILNPDQVQSLLQHLQHQVRSSEHVVRIQEASVTEGGYITPQSTSGIIPSLSSNLCYEDHYHHQCLSSLYNTLPRGSWIFNSVATMYV